MFPFSSPQHCPDCAPTLRRSHRSQKFQNTINDFVEYIFPDKIFMGIEKYLHPYILRCFFSFLHVVRVLQERDISPATPIHNRSRVVLDEAIKRGFSMKVLSLFGRNTNFFALYTEKGRHFFDGLPGLDPTKHYFDARIDDKDHARILLRTMGAPTPMGKAFRTMKSALAYARHIGGPWVVKPSTSSLSNHVRVHICTEHDLIDAITSVLRVTRSFVVESFIEGDLYRATTVGNSLVAVCRRDCPIIIGDGTQTIGALIAIFDTHRRYLLEKIGYHGEKIPALPVISSLQASRVLTKGELFPLTWKTNVSFGGTVTDVTDQVHPDTLQLFEKIATHIGLPTLGIDFMVPDISVSWKKQKCAVIELNSLPSIDLHYPPIVQGKTQNIAGKLLDLVYNTDDYADRWVK